MGLVDIAKSSEIKGFSASACKKKGSSSTVERTPVPAFGERDRPALGIAERVWTVGDLVDAALATQPITPVTTAPDRRRAFTVIDGGRS